MAQERYERVRAYALADPGDRPRVSPAQFDFRRLQRLGMLGLVDRPVRRARTATAEYEVQLVALEADDVDDRLERLCELLGKRMTEPAGGDDATCGTLCAGLDRTAGEGANDPKPARRHHPFRG